jgi:ABC-type multidrug transport system fused ATPase/permease subunit
MNGNNAFDPKTTVGPVTYSKTDKEGVDELQIYRVESGVFRAVDKPFIPKFAMKITRPQGRRTTPEMSPFTKVGGSISGPKGFFGSLTEGIQMDAAQSNGNLLEVNNIEVVYNDIIQVLRGVSLNVPQGSIVALLGTNGAGKTTTLRAISGLLKPENGFIRDGYIKFNGVDITNR